MATPVMQNSSALLSTLLQGQGVTPGQLGAGQLVDGQGKNLQGDFLSSLQNSLDQLLQLDAGAAQTVNPNQLLQDIQKLLNGQLPVNGNGLPLATGQNLPLTTAEGEALEGLDLQELAKRLQALMDNKEGSSEQPLNFPFAAHPSVLNPAAAAVEAAKSNENGNQPVLPIGQVQAAGAQLLAERRRMAERINSMAEVRTAVNDEAPEVTSSLDKSGQAQTMAQQLQAQRQQGELQENQRASTDWMRQIYNGQSKSSQESVVESAHAREQQVVSLINESRSAMSALKVAVAADSALASEGPDNTINMAGFSQQAARPAASPLTSEARPMPMQTFISTHMQDPQWQNDFSQRVNMLARNGSQTAEIRLNPANLGPIEVRVVMNDDQASISFTAQHGAVRDAIEASLPRLREMFSASGLQLADAQVSDQSLQEQHQQRREQENPAHGYGNQTAGQGVPGGRDEMEMVMDLSHIQSAADVRGIDLFA